MYGTILDSSFNLRVLSNKWHLSGLSFEVFILLLEYEIKIFSPSSYRVDKTPSIRSLSIKDVLPSA